MAPLAAFATFAASSDVSLTAEEAASLFSISQPVVTLCARLLTLVAEGRLALGDADGLRLLAAGAVPLTLQPRLLRWLEPTWGVFFFDLPHEQLEHCGTAALRPWPFSTWR